MLRIEHATKRFGALIAVDSISVEIGDTGITGLVGPNGSGKTTLFHLITGFYALDEGAVFFENHRISGLAPDIISRRGLIRTFQQTRVLPLLTTLENLMAAAPRQIGEKLFPLFFKRKQVRREEKYNREKALQVLDLIQLLPLADELAGRLSYGQQKLVELGRVLMGDPKMILLDEPTAGINPSLTLQLVKIIKNLSRQGIQIFMIEHNMPLVAEICEQVFVMDSGQLIFRGAPAEAQKNERVIEAYLGRDNRAA